MLAIISVAIPILFFGILGTWMLSDVITHGTPEERGYAATGCMVALMYAAFISGGLQWLKLWKYSHSNTVGSESPPVEMRVTFTQQGVEFINDLARRTDSTFEETIALALLEFSRHVGTSILPIKKEKPHLQLVVSNKDKNPPGESQQ
ncbi:MAG: hypothetical protein KW788_04175 [Candidatus Doudnabacteria bacterium]|nr:hypothetical protein [Candidatus Doudnabacteria bacterium]